jgi:hypothetical protein
MDGKLHGTWTGANNASAIVAAFDDEGILIINRVGNRLSLWKAADPTPSGSFSMGVGAHAFLKLDSFPQAKEGKVWVSIIKPRFRLYKYPVSIPQLFAMPPILGSAIDAPFLPREISLP